jgi:ribulose-5-phosphate 4-epimerase/fuculose-1-phosphate aldolase
MVVHDEGVIKFHAEHRHAPLDPGRHGELACRLIAWREILARTGLVGQDPALYGGFGYGNISGRVGPPSAPRGRRSFLITGTQTSGKACVCLADLCVVERFDAATNRAWSSGTVLPSSESLTHGAIYDLGPHIRFVFHGHSRTLWRRAQELRIPTSDPGVAYGTTEMAAEVGRLFRSTALSEVQILAMGGHEDGIVVFGRNAEEAGQVLLRYLARAYEADCAAAGGLCYV